MVLFSIQNLEMFWASHLCLTFLEVPILLNLVLMCERLNLTSFWKKLS